MSGFDLSAALKTVAPTLATMLGGPLAGTAVMALESAFGLEPSKTTADGITNIKQAIQKGQMTPDVIAKIRETDQKHAEVMGQQGLDLAKINADHEAAMAETAAQDRDSARKREASVRDRTPAHLAYVMIGGFFALSAAMLYVIGWHSGQLKNIDGQGWLLIGSIMGYVANEAKAAAAYYFGTTQGSDKKTDLLAQAQSTEPDNVVPIGKKAA